MGNAPSLGNIEIKHFCQLVRSLLCHGISPGAERYQQFILFIEYHVAVHHGAESHSSQFCNDNAVFFLYVLCHLCVAVLKPCPDILQGIGPDIIFQTVFPVMAAGCNGGIIFPDEHCFNTGGTKLNTQHCVSAFNHIFYIFQIKSHKILPPIFFSFRNCSVPLQLPGCYLIFTISVRNRHLPRVFCNSACPAIPGVPALPAD